VIELLTIVLIYLLYKSATAFTPIPLTSGYSLAVYTRAKAITCAAGVLIASSVPTHHASILVI